MPDRVGRVLVLGEARVLDVFRRFDAMVISLPESRRNEMRTDQSEQGTWKHNNIWDLPESWRFEALLPLVETCNSSSISSSELSSSEWLSASSSSSSTSEWLKSASDALARVRVARLGESKASCVDEAVRVLRRVPFVPCEDCCDALVERLDKVLVSSCCEPGVSNLLALRVGRAGEGA